MPAANTRRPHTGVLGRDQYPITPDQPLAFVDFPPLPGKPPEHLQDHTERCPVCRGHGGWNLRLAEQLPTVIAGGIPFVNTPENRHRYAHQRSVCGACWGYGWLVPGSCPHDWERGHPAANDWQHGAQGTPRRTAME